MATLAHRRVERQRASAAQRRQRRERVGIGGEALLCLAQARRRARVRHGQTRAAARQQRVRLDRCVLRPRARRRATLWHCDGGRRRGAGVQQRLHRLDVADHGGSNQRRHAAHVLRVKRAAIVAQHRHPVERARVRLELRGGRARRQHGERRETLRIEQRHQLD
jgi:hypothetical protein